jgi:NarL family two-component system response regulator LiaR
MVRVFLLMRYRAVAEALAQALEGNHGISSAAPVPPRDPVPPVVTDADQHVIVVQADLEHDDGTARLAQLLEADPRRAGVVLLERPDPLRAMAAVRAGALGVITMSADIQVLISVVLGVARGEGHMTPSLLGEFFSRIRQQVPQSPAGASRWSSLTRRECEILWLTANGMDPRTIAAELCCSVLTIRTHNRKLYRKLGVHSRAEAISAARAFGWV